MMYEVMAIVGFRGPRAQVAATVAEVGRAQGLAVAMIGVAPDTVALGPVSVAKCQATYHVTFSDADRADPRVTAFVRGIFYEPGDTVSYLVKSPDSGCGRDAWDQLMRIGMALDQARREGR